MMPRACFPTLCTQLSGARQVTGQKADRESRSDLLDASHRFASCWFPRPPQQKPTIRSAPGVHLPGNASVSLSHCYVEEAPLDGSSTTYIVRQTRPDRQGERTQI